MSIAPTLNYHHLQYFWAVAHRGNLSRTAQDLRISPSALSTQIRQLEANLGAPLFLREGRSLVLTEAGRVALAHADAIFAQGRELLSTFGGVRDPSAILRIGAVATLSRNFQESFLEPLLSMPHVRLRLVSGGLVELLGMLREHHLDLVLANTAIAEIEVSSSLRSRQIARQRVSFVCSKKSSFNLRRDGSSVSFLLPGARSAINAGFHALCTKLGVIAEVRAEVDDMAMLRLLARDTEAVAVVPPVVVRDELRAKRLHDLGPVAGLEEDFYAVTADRKFPHPLVETLMKRSGPDVLAAQRP